MENDKLKYILAKQNRLSQSKEETFLPVGQTLKMKYVDFNIAYGMTIDYDFDGFDFLAKRIEEYREGQKVKAILLEKDFIRIFLIKNAK